MSSRVAQVDRTPGADRDDGQLMVRSWLRPGKTALVSGTVTAGALEREMRRRETLNGHQSGALVDLHLALQRMGAAAYGRAEVETADLDEALNAGSRGVAAVRRANGWFVKQMNALVRLASGVRGRVWAR